MQKEINKIAEHGIVWYAKKLLERAEHPTDINDAVNKVAGLLIGFKDSLIREFYTNEILDNTSIKKANLKNALSRLDKEKETIVITEDTNLRLPKWADADRVYNHRIDWRENAGLLTGYWSHENNQSFTQVTNFIIKPLYILKSINGETKRLGLLHVHGKEDQLIEIPSKAFNSVEFFQTMTKDRGYYKTEDSFSKSSLNRIFSAIGDKFYEAEEFSYLGFQPEGFFAYSNAVFVNNQLSYCNKYGMVQVGNNHFFSPSSSEINDNKRTDEEGKRIKDGNIYFNDKSLTYREAPVSFETYCQHLVKMHKDAALPLICFGLATLFKDFIVRYEKMPLLYGYGQVESGKSTWAEALYWLFFDHDSKAFNLNQGTVYAFWNRMGRFQNCVQLFNEFDENSNNPEFVRAFKAYYDQEGRDRGAGVKGKVETQEVRCGAIIIGQVLSTQGDGALPTRSIAVEFTNKGGRTAKDKELFDTWNKWIIKGMGGSLIEPLKYRRYFKDNFITKFNENLNKLKQTMTDNGDSFKERIAKNYCILLTAGNIIGDKMNLGFSYESLFTYCLNGIINLSKLIGEVDNLGIFWKTIDFLYEKGEIAEGTDFRIETEMKVKKNSGKEPQFIEYNQPTDILYLRLSKIYSLYAQSYRQTSGNKPINQKTLESYFLSCRAYIGVNPSMSFKAPGGGRQITSCFMFKYSELSLNLQKSFEPEEETKKDFNQKCFITKSAEECELHSGKHFLAFTVGYYNENASLGIDALHAKCFTNQLALINRLTRDKNVRIKGKLLEKVSGSYTTRTIDCSSITIVNEDGMEEILDVVF